MADVIMINIAIQIRSIQLAILFKGNLWSISMEMILPVNPKIAMPTNSVECGSVAS